LRFAANARLVAGMKVLFLVRDLAIGGSQRQLAALAVGLAERGHEVAVALLYADGELETDLRHRGVRLVPIGKSSRWHAIGPAAKIRRLLLAESADLLYAFLPTQTTLAALLLPRQLKTKLVFGLRASGVRLDRYDYLNALTYRSEAWLSRRADLIIANAHSVRADAIDRGFPSERIAIIANGIDTNAMRPDAAAGQTLRKAWGLSHDTFVIGCVARLDPMKDHQNFLTAAAHFTSKNPAARFVCVGDGPSVYRDQLKALAHSLGVADRVLWPGQMRDVKAAFNAFDIVTLSSAFGEGFPNVVGEAMACGVPVVATDVGDVKAIIGQLGEIVPAGQPESLCAGWIRLRERLAQEPGLGKAARDAIVTNYGLDAMVERTDRLLQQVAAGRPAADIAHDFG
jgi:glycosyltransferase involved in cell wall biosynthesis